MKYRYRDTPSEIPSKLGSTTADNVAELEIGPIVPKLIGAHFTDS